MDSSAANQKKKGKGMSVENILKKRNKEFNYNLLHQMRASDRE